MGVVGATKALALVRSVCFDDFTSFNHGQHQGNVLTLTGKS